MAFDTQDFIVNHNLGDFAAGWKLVNQGLQLNDNLNSKVAKSMFVVSGAGEKLAGSITRVNDLGQQLVTTQKKVDDQLKVVSQTITTNYLAQEKLAERQKARAEANAKRLTARIAREKKANDSRILSETKLAQIERDREAQSIQRSQAIITRLRQRAALQVQTLQRQQSAANRAAAAAEKRAASAEKLRLKQQQLRVEEEKLERLRLRARQSAKLAARTIISGTDFSQATVAQKTAFIQQTARLRQLLEKHQLTTARINSLWAQVARGNIQVYTGALRLVQLEMIKLRNQQHAFGTQQEKVTKSTEKFVLTWKSLGRLLAVQLAHQAISTLSNALREAVVTAQELQIKIAEIQTIDVTNLGFTTLSEQLTRVSSAFGVPVIDQAEAAYQALSNQVVRGAETFRFLATANRLAIAGVTTSTNAVQLLSSAINAFNIPVEEAERISASFFKTVELGRVRIDEMAESFGRIAVPAAQLGITLEELEAAITTATIRGIKFSESSTLLRNVLLKLIRPTDAMKGFFSELGVASGEAAIATFGLQGFLARLEEKSRGSSAELGELFGRIRAITGAMIFANEGIDTFTKNLAEIEDPFADFSTAVETVLANTGQRFKIALNEIKNFFIQDFAGEILKTLAFLTGNFENAKTIILETAAAITTGLAVSIGLLTVQFRKLLITLAISPFAGAFLAITAMFVLIRRAAFEARRLTRAFEEASAKREQNRLREDAKEEGRFSASLNRAKRFINFRTRIFLQSSSAVIASYNLESATQKENFDALEDDIKSITKATTKFVRDQITEITRQIKTLQKEIEKGRDAIASLFRSADRQLFDLNLEGLTPTAQIKEIQKRISDLRSQSLEAATAGDLDTFKAIRSEVQDLFNEQVKLQKETSKEFGFAFDKIKFQEKLIELVREEANLRRNIIEDQLAKQRELRTKRQEEISLQGELEELSKRIVKFDSIDIIKTKDLDFIEQKFERQQADLLRLIELREKAGLDSVKTDRLRKSFQQNEIILLEKLNKLKLEAATKEVLTREKSLKLQISALQATRLEAKKLSETITKSISDQLGVIEANTIRINKSDPFAVSDAPDTAFLFRNFSQLREAFKEGKLALVELEIFKQELINNQSWDPNNPNKLRNLPVLLEIVENLISQFDPNFVDLSEGALKFQKRLLDFRELLKDTVDKGGDASLQELLRVSTSRLAHLEEEFKSNQKIIEELNNDNKTFLERGLSEINILNTRIDELKTAINDLQDEIIAQGGTPPKTLAAGGRLSLGTDTIPAMLTPGEFVVNRMAANKFLPQLLAMNSGIQPRSFASGGPVSNFSGDFNISLESSGKTETDIVAIGRGLKNEIRRGRLQL